MSGVNCRRLKRNEMQLAKVFKAKVFASQALTLVLDDSNPIANIMKKALR